MRARCRMLLLVLAIVGLSCTGDEPAPTDVSSEPTGQPSSSASPEVSPLVGEWKRVTKCQELVQLLEANGLGSRAPQAIEGNGWVDGTLEQLAEEGRSVRRRGPTGALPLLHRVRRLRLTRLARGTGRRRDV